MGQRSCKECGTDISDMSAKAKFCSEKCKNTYNYRERKSSEDYETAPGLGSITPNSMASPMMPPGMEGMGGFIFMQEAQKAQQLTQEKATLQGQLNQALSTIQEMKMAKVTADAQHQRELDAKDKTIEKLQEAGENSKGLNGLVDKVTSNPETLQVVLGALTPLWLSAKQGGGQLAGAASAHSENADKLATWFDEIPSDDLKTRFWQIVLAIDNAGVNLDTVIKTIETSLNIAA